MRIAKPILMVTTPIGLLEGLYECYKLAGGLVLLMAAISGSSVRPLSMLSTFIDWPSIPEYP